MDTKAFHTLSYGMYIIASGDAQGRSGCVVNTFAQVTGNPPRATVAVNKENATADVIRRIGRYTASVLGEQAPMELIGRFGFRTSTDYDKFSETIYAIDSVGMPTVTDHAVACFEVRVTETIDVGSHWLFIGDVEDARALGNDDAPMTYAYYHQVKGGKTPPKASSYIDEKAQLNSGAAAAPTSMVDSASSASTTKESNRAKDAASAEPSEEKAAEQTAKPEEAEGPATQAEAAPGTTVWRCMLCGYEVTINGDELPADFTCPMCGAGREMFERVN